MKVSVIVTVYNCEKYVYKCISSLINQNFDDYEIIVVNDGSKDDSLNVIKSLMPNERIVLVDKDNTGAGDSRNVGLSMAKGEYVIFLDSDDFFDKSLLNYSYSKAKADDLDICIFNSDMYIEKYHLYLANKNLYNYKILKKGTFSAYSERDNLFCICNGWAWDKLFKREFVVNNKILFQKIRSSNDLFFSYANMALASKIGFCNKTLVHQRRAIKSSLSATNHVSWECCFTALKELYSFLHERELFDTFKKTYYSFGVKFLVWHISKYPIEPKRNLFNLLREKICELGLNDINNDMINKDVISYYKCFQSIMSLGFEDYVKVEKKFLFRNRIKTMFKKV